MPLPDDYYSRKDGNYKVYVLELVGGYYYVGMTKQVDVPKRFEQHVKGIYSSQWTRRHKPIRVLEIRELGWVTYSEACKRETMVTMEYIDQYGLSYVRGGIITLQDDQAAIKRLATALSLYG